MKILVVAGYCLQVNSSANLCHISYIKGLVDCGHTVDLLTVSNKNQINVADAKTEMQTEQSIYGFRGTTAAILSLLLYI